MTWILERLKEKSTWAGIATAVGASGIAWATTDFVTAIGAVVISVIGLYEVIRKERD